MRADDVAGPQARDARPSLGFRVGVTGHRKFAAVEPSILEASVARVLEDVERILGKIAAEARARLLYAKGPPLLRIVSPLAEGADRLVAGLALARGWRLAAPLPFPRGEYERDFGNSLEEFRGLLARAEAEDQIVELDGTRQEENSAYLDVGRFVLRHSDLLIALWDGNRAQGIGGTGQIVEEAQALAIPIVHLSTTAEPEIRLFGGAREPIAYDATELERIIRRSVLPEWPRSKRRRKQENAAAAYLMQERVRKTEDQPDFLYRGPFAARSSWLGRLFPAFIKLLSGSVAAKEKIVGKPQPAGARNGAAEAFYLHFQRADALATYYAGVHRSGFVLIYILGSLSLVFAFTTQFLRGVWIGGEHAGTWTTAAELCTLASIFVIYVVERYRRWRERWLDYRLLAEMLREADLLARIGGVPLTGSLDRAGEMHPERGWVSWFVAAVTRSLGVVGARFDQAYLEAVRDYATHTRLQDQIAYHARTARQNASVSRKLRRMSEALFGLTLLAIVSEFYWPEGMHLAWPAWLAGIFPAIAAMSFGIRNQAEFEIVVDRSARLRSRLEQERDQIVALKGERLKSATLGRMIVQATRVMQNDTAEWAAIFEVKESEVV